LPTFGFPIIATYPDFVFISFLFVIVKIMI